MRQVRRLALVSFFLAVACHSIPTDSGREAKSAGGTHAHDPAQARDPELCTRCHQGTPAAWTLAPSGNSSDHPRFALDGVAMCIQCHEADVSHMVGMEVDFSIPDDLPLSEDGTVTCLTCHKPHGPLRSDRPWANVSILDRWLDTEAMHKTYLLRRTNEHGELCLLCHAAEKD
jgi:hypothetical protein